MAGKVNFEKAPGVLSSGASILRSFVLRSGIGYSIPTLVLLFVFFITPVISLLMRSVLEPEPGLQNFEILFTTSTYARVFGNTFLVSSVVTVVTILVGYPIAWFLAIMPRKWSNIVFSIIVLSMWTNLLARTYGWMILLQRTGLINKVLINLGLIDSPLPLINNLTGVTIGMVYIMLPFVILPLHATMSSVDSAILQSAAICGAGRWQAFRRVLLPLTLPGLAAGGLMVFVMSLGYFVTPALLGGPSTMMFGELIALLIQSLLNWGLGGAAAFVLLVVTLSIYAVQIRYFGNRLG